MTTSRSIDEHGNKSSSARYIGQSNFRPNKLDTSEILLAELLRKVTRIEQKIDRISKSTSLA